jgi:hypothetical protein
MYASTEKLKQRSIAMDLAKLEDSSASSLGRFLMEEGGNWHRLLCPRCVPSIGRPISSTEEVGVRLFRDTFTYEYLMCLGGKWIAPTHVVHMLLTLS